MNPGVLMEGPASGRAAGAARAETTRAMLNPARHGPVLLATHGRESSDAPLRLARRLADRLGLELHVVTVIEPLPIQGSASDVAMAPMPFDVEPHSVREETVRRQVVEQLGTDAGHTLNVRYGPAVREIALAAEALDATVVVVGAAPHRFLRHTVAGQRAAQLLRKLGCPVLSVTADQTELPRRVMAAVDFSPASMRAAEAALLLVDDNAHVTLLHVAPEFVFGELFADASQRVVAADVGRAIERLRDDLYRHAPDGVTIDTRVVAGGVVNAVLALADDARADLIAVGTHGPNVIERFFIGSVAGILLHVAPTNVLASPAPDPVDDARRHAMTVVTERPAEWPDLLQAFNDRNLSRRVIVEVDDPEIGAQVQARGYLFQGAAWDPVDARVDVMLGAVAGDMAHLTRSIRGVTSIAVSRIDDGRDRALEVRHERGHTLLIFEH